MQMGYIAANENTTTITNSNYTNGQYEEVEYPRRDTITIQTAGPVSIDQIFTYFDNLSILDQVGKQEIYKLTLYQFCIASNAGETRF